MGNVPPPFGAFRHPYDTRLGDDPDDDDPREYDREDDREDEDEREEAQGR